jgi:hypothetical protein
MNIRLLKDLNFAEKINQTEAVTEAGKDMLKSYRGYMYTNAPTCGIVNGFIAEAQNFSFDTGLVSILNSVLDFVNENKISWKLASACESISANNSNYGYIAKVGIETVGKLLQMNEADVVSYIKAGSLKSVQYIPEFRAICKEVYNTTLNETRTQQYTMVNPISFVYENENGTQYFNVLGKTYKSEDGCVSEAICDNKQFATVNSLLESFKTDGNNLYVDYRGVHGDTARFTIVESEGSSKIEFTKGNVSESFDSVVAFNEYCNNASKVMMVAEKMNWLKATNVIAQVYEASSKIVALDNVNIVSTQNGTLCAIIEGKNNVNLTVFRSYNAGTSCNNYEYMVEALTQLTKISGVDLKSQYTDRINEDCKKQDPEGAKAIAESVAALNEEAMDARKKKIAKLAEQYKNDPAKIALLNEAARNLAVLG